MKPKLTIIDTPLKINLANYEQRLRRYRYEFGLIVTQIGLIVTQIDDALERLEADRKREESS